MLNEAAVFLSSGGISAMPPARTEALNLFFSSKNAAAILVLPSSHTTMTGLARFIVLSWIRKVKNGALMLSFR
jgi:hypothetical protein